MNRLTKYILSTAFLFACVLQLAAQNQVSKVTGTVKDSKGGALIGAIVVVRNQPGLGAVTDEHGKFAIKVGANEVLQVSFMGYEKKDVPVNGKNVINIVLEENTHAIDAVTVVGASTQRTQSIVGAITQVDVKTLESPTSSISNALAGNVSGIIARQTSGEPGRNTSEFWIRGISTFGASSSALVLVDGVERSLNELNVEDIQSFSVLKDASATAIYGQRGANGVIIITTKRGEAGRVKIFFKTNYGVNTPLKMPSYIGGVQYAQMANEARLSRYQSPLFSTQEIDILKYNLDPDLYPNVDWKKQVLKGVTHNYQAVLNLSGGGATARYFVSGSYYNEDGMYKTSSLNKYNTNSTYSRFNYRSNVDMNVTRSTLVSLGVGGWSTSQTKPGGDNGNDIWGSIVNLTPVTVPVMYSNGLVPTYGTGNTTNPNTLLNQNGYKTIWENQIETNISLKQDFGFLTEGLSATATFAFDSYSISNVDRLQRPDLYRAERQRDGNGNMVLNRVATAIPLFQGSGSAGNVRYYTELKAEYSRLLAKKHRIGGLLLYYQQETKVNNAGGDIYSSVPNRNMAFSGRVTYAYNDRYMLEFNAGYTGSQNFQPGHQFGFFPAIAGGWLISEESFVKKNAPWINQLKLRYSYGRVGNDVMPNGARFPYISTVGGLGGYSFGSMGQTYIGGIGIYTQGSQGLTWEEATKNDFGIDVRLFNKFSGTIDFFRDNRDKIFMKRSNIPYTVGIDTGVNNGGQQPWANVGQMLSQGVDGQVAYTDKIGKVNFTLRANATFTRQHVIADDEAANALPYQMGQGYAFGQTRGLIALGLFKDENEIKNSPQQHFGGTILPGDIKYKDVNGDGVIDSKDVVPIGHTTIPGVIYGVGASASWNNFDFSMLWQGAGNSDFMIGGNGVNPFRGGEMGNILVDAANPANRWISSEISGATNTENLNAEFPRLTYGDNPNNYQGSTFWMRNGRYLRFKNLEIGYTIPQKITRHYKIEKLRIYFMGNDLAVFSPFKMWDPEVGSGDGANYPISRYCQFGLTVNL